MNGDILHDLGETKKEKKKCRTISRQFFKNLPCIHETYEKNLLLFLFFSFGSCKKNRFKNCLNVYLGNYCTLCSAMNAQSEAQAHEWY